MAVKKRKSLLRIYVPEDILQVFIVKVKEGVEAKIKELQKSKLTIEHIKRMQWCAEDVEKNSDLLFDFDRLVEADMLFRNLCFCIAVMSFYPGGIEVLGESFIVNS